MKLYTLQLQSETARGQVLFYAEKIEDIKVSHHIKGKGDYKIISSGEDFGLFMFILLLFHKCESSLAKKADFYSLLEKFDKTDKKVKERITLPLDKFTDEDEICLFAFRDNLKLEEGLYDALAEYDAPGKQYGMVMNSIISYEV